MLSDENLLDSTLRMLRCQFRLILYVPRSSEWWRLRSLACDVTLKHTSINDVAELMRCFTSAIPQVGKALAQCAGHKGTLCHSTSRFEGKASDS